MMSFPFNIFFSVLWVTTLVENSIGQVGTKCPGPLMHYKALGCKPVYDFLNDDCAVKYECENFSKRPANKCIVNGRTYNIGDELISEDANPCDQDCHCIMRDNFAQFSCAIVDCFPATLEPNCYLRKNVRKCCSDYTPICPKRPDYRPTCVVKGKVYKDGEYFTWQNKPCYCGPNFFKENIESFCRTQKQDLCSLELRHSFQVRNNYPPVFYEHQSEQTDCGIDFRYQNPRDSIIKYNGTDIPFRTDLDCFFGNMTLGVGDTLVPATDYDSVCVDCKCEVPPILTCRHRPAKDCNPSVHEDFSKYHKIHN